MAVGSKPEGNPSNARLLPSKVGSCMLSERCRMEEAQVFDDSGKLMSTHYMSTGQLDVTCTVLNTKGKNAG